MFEESAKSSAGSFTLKNNGRVGDAGNEVKEQRNGDEKGWHGSKR